MTQSTAEEILRELTDRQHLAPHLRLKNVVAETVDATGACPAAAARAVAWLGLSPDRSIGRLRRSELMQLARCMHRFGTDAASSPADAASRSD